MPEPLFNKDAGLRPEACKFIKKETLAQVFSCEFCEILKNTFFYRTPPMAASEYIMIKNKNNNNVSLLLILNLVNQTE